MSTYGIQTKKVPAAIQQAAPVHVEEMAETIGLVSERISSGQAYLKIVAYPWGVEFDVCDGEAQP